MKKLILTIFFLITTISIFACDSLNCFDSKGNKTGLWVTNMGNQTQHLYYTNGKLNGVCRYYWQNGRLSYLGVNSNGEPTGKGYYFDEETPFLLYIWDSIGGNTRTYIQHDSLDETKVIHATSKYSCHFFEYNRNGTLNADGLILFDESPDFESLRYGIWNFYDSNGKLIKRIDYKDSYLLNEIGEEIR